MGGPSGGNDTWDSQKVCASIFHRTWIAQETWWVWPVVRDQGRPRQALGPPYHLLIVNPDHSGQGFPRDPWKHLEKSLYLCLFVCVEGGDSICVHVCNERVEATDRAMGAFLLQLYTLPVETGLLTGPEVYPSALTTTATNNNQSPTSPPLPPLPSPPE